MLEDAGTLVLRGTTGSLLAGHGAQKLFGAFEGPGLKGTAGFMEALGLQPGHYWGTAAALSEFGGGALTALGLLYPLGPISAISAMAMATAKAHWGKPIWVSSGGAELPLTNMAAMLALALAGPGRYSLDRALGIKLPGWVGGVAALAAAGAVAYGVTRHPQPAPAAEEEARTAAQGGAEAQGSTIDAAADQDKGAQLEATSDQEPSQAATPGTV